MSRERKAWLERQINPLQRGMTSCNDNEALFLLWFLHSFTQFKAKIKKKKKKTILVRIIKRFFLIFFSSLSHFQKHYNVTWCLSTTVKRGYNSFCMIYKTRQCCGITLVREYVACKEMKHERWLSRQMKGIVHPASRLPFRPLLFLGWPFKVARSGFSEITRSRETCSTRLDQTRHNLVQYFIIFFIIVVWR